MSHPEIGNYKYVCVLYRFDTKSSAYIFYMHLPYVKQLDKVIIVYINIIPYHLVFVVLGVEGIKPRHCKLNFSSGNVSLIVEEGLCSINSEKVDVTKDLYHGK